MKPSLRHLFCPARLLAMFLALTPGVFALAHEIGPEMLDTLPVADIVILGEVHDNPEHHQNQARAVVAIAPRALVWEMLTAEQAARMPAARSDAREVAAAIDWQGSGWPDFALYHPILMAAPEAQIYGAGVPRGVARRVFTEPLADVFGDIVGADAARFGLAEPLMPEEQVMREAEQAAAHCHALPENLLPGMVSAQRLRDAAMAHVALQALAETGGPVVLITGTVHARADTGVPAFLRHADEGARVLSLGQLETDPGAEPPFDFWIVTEAAPRPDPCESLR